MLKSICNQTDPNKQFKKSIGRPHFPTCTRSTNFPQVVSVKSRVSQHKSCLHRLATGKHSSGDCVQPPNWHQTSHPGPALRRKSRVRATVAAAVAEPGGGRQCWESHQWESPPSSIRGARGGPLQLLHSSWCSQLWRWQHRVASEPDTLCLLRKGRSGTQGSLDITSNPVLSTLYMRTGFANSETCATSRRSCDTLDC